MSIQGHSITESIIKSGFWKTGLYPVDHEVFTNADFVPSHALSTQVHVPASFPPDIPFSDPAILSDAELECDFDSANENPHHTINTITMPSDDELKDDSYTDSNPSDSSDVTGEDSSAHQTHSMHAENSSLNTQMILATYTNVPAGIDQEKSQLKLFSEVQSLHQSFSMHYNTSPLKLRLQKPIAQSLSRSWRICKFSFIMSKSKGSEGQTKSKLISLLYQNSRGI